MGDYKCALNFNVREAENELHLTVFLIRTAERLSLEKK